MEIINNESFEAIFQEIEKSKNHYFITGNAGTGKSTLLRYIRRKTRKNTAVLAPTGLAALNVQGETIHSFFRFGIAVKIANIKRSQIPTHRRKLQGIKRIIIDEVSMLRADLLDCMDYALRLNRNKDLPFGGVQMIFIGDLFQLPPVIKTIEWEEFKAFYPSPYFFDAHCIPSMNLQFIELEHIYRQSSKAFITLLNHIRNREVEEEDFELLNGRYVSSLDEISEDYVLTLTTTNKVANVLNQKHLEQLPGPASVFVGQVHGNYDNNMLPNEQNLVLKVGSQVLFIKNDTEGRYVNGTLGRVVDIEGEKVDVELSDGKVIEVEAVRWDQVEWVVDTETGEIKEKTVGFYKQLPLRLAWAITIHKSQGMTFDKVVIDLGMGSFAHGQLYVALSRCRTLEGIYLLKKVRFQDIILDERIHEFLYRMRRK